MSARSGPRTRRVIPSALAAPLAALLASAALAACSGEPARSAAIGTDAPVIVPQGPGAPGRTATPGERLGLPPAGPVAADVRFAEGMIPHHRQALEMAGLVPDRTATPAVRRFADRIASAQGPEITAMSSWLTALGRPVPAGHAHAPAGYGMASPREMNALRAARGPAFDRLFLTLMIRHHGGALKMAGEELAGGADQVMRRTAQDVYAGQSIEAARMEKTRSELPAGFRSGGEEGSGRPEHVGQLGVEIHEVGLATGGHLLVGAVEELGQRGQRHLEQRLPER